MRWRLKGKKESREAYAGVVETCRDVHPSVISGIMVHPQIQFGLGFAHNPLSHTNIELE